MNKYICPNCHKQYYEVELFKTKCSENQCGGYIDMTCKKCYGKLETVKEVVDNAVKQ